MFCGLALVLVSMSVWTGALKLSDVVGACSSLERQVWMDAPPRFLERRVCMDTTLPFVFGLAVGLVG